MSYLQITASDLSDQVLKDFLEMEPSQIVTMYIQSVDQTAAIKQIKHKITELDRSKIEKQKKAVRSGIFESGSCKYDKQTVGQHLLIRIIRHHQIIHSGQLLFFRKRLPAMFLFSKTLSRSPFFGDGLTLRLMPDKKYQFHAEMP